MEATIAMTSYLFGHSNGIHANVIHSPASCYFCLIGVVYYTAGGGIHSFRNDRKIGKCTLHM